jgi:hypothetical protein
VFGGQNAKLRHLLPGNETGITKEHQKNDEIRMTKLERMTNDQMTLWRQPCRLHSIVLQATRLPLQRLRASFVIRHSCFVICSVAILVSTTKTMAQSLNMTGRWNVEIIFADGNKRFLRFDAQEAGKGTLLAVDPRAKGWGPAKPSEAKWTPGDQNSITFSGAAEFMLGNVGRDAGTLMFKGKFETPDAITGEVEFAPLVGDRPSKHGTFKATRGSSSH